VLLTNSGTWPRLVESGLALVESALDELVLAPEPWRPENAPSEEVDPLLGRWWSEGQEFVFAWRHGRLEARLATAPPEREPAVFEPEGEDRFRTVSGRERGELLRVVRDDEGAIVKLYWATYPFTRTPEIFGATEATPERPAGL
jgi:hypothetical protein